MFIKKYINESIIVQQKMLDDNAMLETVENVANLIVDAYKNDKKVLLAGNGGSAGDAQHIAAELVSKLNMERPGLSAIALTTDSSILTAISNDFGFENVFARQIQALGKNGDVFVAISTSGKSENIINALELAKKLGLSTVGFSGEKFSDMSNFCDFEIKVPTENTQKIQEIHIMLGHLVCALVEKKLFGLESI